MKRKTLNQSEIDQINYLYWDEGWEQKDIGVMFDMHQSNISRYVNQVYLGHNETLARKIPSMFRRISLNKCEPKNALTLRKKREKLHNTKLSWKKVQQIRAEFFTMKMTQVELAKKYGVNQSNISLIINGHKWKKIQ